MDKLCEWATKWPEKSVALIAETGESLSYQQLHERSARLCSYLVKSGLEPGDTVALLIGNSLSYFELCWAALRAGLYFASISTHLKAAETQYILEDSGAKVLFVSSAYKHLLDEMPRELLARIEVLFVDGTAAHDIVNRYERISGAGEVPTLPDRPDGRDFPYSSGTTGRPKGIRLPLLAQDAQNRAFNDWVSYFDFNPEMVYLSPAPLYHAAPSRYCIRTQAAGGTVVVMRKFDAKAALDAIARYRITHSQWVPTMLIRLLALPEEVRAAADLSSMQRAVHAAAPCPRDVKLRMLDWWGPILWEYYSGSERNGATVISPQDWLHRQGSVGRAALGEIHIVSEEDGHECAAGEEGLVYFANGPRFEYHNDPDKTAAAYDDRGRSTIGDIGYVDKEGYLFLTDRRANMIITGGVNVYPQEVENLLLTHPSVADVAVVGVPHSDLGEEVVGVVELRDPSADGEALAEELIAFCRAHLSHVKCPRRIDFSSGLPRSETGKLLKRVVRDQYRERLKAKTV